MVAVKVDEMVCSKVELLSQTIQKHSFSLKSNKPHMQNSLTQELLTKDQMTSKAEYCFLLIKF